MGVQPVGAIVSSALHKSADKFKEKYPKVSKQLKEDSYVDDLQLTSTQDKTELRLNTSRADKILVDADMKVKRWIYYGEEDVDVTAKISEIVDKLLSDNEVTEQVLGIEWRPARDVFTFKVHINLSPLKKKSRVGPDITKEELQNSLPEVITCQMYYSTIQALFDPIGFLSPGLLKGKLIQRSTWEGEC